MNKELLSLEVSLDDEERDLSGDVINRVYSIRAKFKETRVGDQGLWTYYIEYKCYENEILNTIRQILNDQKEVQKESEEQNI